MLSNMKMFGILPILIQFFWVVKAEGGCITTLVAAVDPCKANPCYNQGMCVSFGTGLGGERKRRALSGGGGLIGGGGGLYGGGMYGGGGVYGSRIGGIGGLGGFGGLGGGRRAGFRCLCRHGFTGRYCQLTDPCDPNPCQNGGTCSEIMGNYTCNCVQNYTGTNCENFST